MYDKFIFVKDCPTDMGIIKKGSELTLINNRMMFNNIMIEPEYYDLMLDIIEYETKNGFNYLKKEIIPYNKV